MERKQSNDAKPFDRFKDVVRRIVSVPKAELVKAAQRDAKKKARKRTAHA